MKQGLTKEKDHLNEDMDLARYFKNMDKLLEIDNMFTTTIEGYKSTSPIHLNWLMYNSEIRGLKVIIVFNMSGGFDGYALIDDDQKLGGEEVLSTRFMKGTVVELIEYLINSFNESTPLVDLMK